MSNVPFTLTKDLFDINTHLVPGMGEWAVHDSSPFPGKEASLIYVCPCGCGTITSISVIPMDNHPVWTWNGDREKPTLSPSILRKDGCKWHGFLISGEWRKA